jgi:hypothetical protein
VVYITAIHMEGGDRHEHIARVRWTNPVNGQAGENSRAEMVDWIGNQSGDAYVTDGLRQIRVRVVNASPPYIQTYADGIWTNNLLALPTF